jgi:DnaJ-class molecular chaperone
MSRLVVQMPPPGRKSLVRPIQNTAFDSKWDRRAVGEEPLWDWYAVCLPLEREDFKQRRERFDPQIAEVSTAPESRRSDTMETRRENERDYYHVLGVRPTTTPADIAAAYYVLARESHPDHHGDDPELTAKLKLINEAYEVLSNEQKRREYDRQRERSRRRPSTRATTRSSPSAPILWTGFTGLEAKTARLHKEPNDIEVDLPITPEEARLGIPCEFVVNTTEPCKSCDGRGSVGDAPCVICNGKGTEARRQLLCVNLPRHVEDGTVLRIPGRGSCGPSRSPIGDLYLCIRIRPSW